jgi:hypothetical protein
MKEKKNEPIYTRCQKSMYKERSIILIREDSPASEKEEQVPQKLMPKRESLTRRREGWRFHKAERCKKIHLCGQLVRMGANLKTFRRL